MMVSSLQLGKHIPLVLGVLCYVVCCTAQDVVVASTAITNTNKPTYTAGGSAQTISVTLGLTVAAGGDDGKISKISVYFTNNAQYESSTVKSTAVDKTFTTEKTVAAGSSDLKTIIENEEVNNMQIDVANCQEYSHLCVVITVTNSGDDVSNNDGCLALGTGATEAGEKKCPDVAAKPSSFVITKPTPSEIVYNTSADSVITFDIEATAADGPGIVTGVKLYFTNKDDYDTADTKSSAFDVGGVTSTNVAAGATEKITGATASLKLDAANCAKYTNLCAVLQISTTDTISNNNDVCNKFGTTTADAGSKVCPEETPDTTTPKDSAATVAGQSILMLLLCMIAVTMDF